MKGYQIFVLALLGLTLLSLCSCSRSVTRSAIESKIYADDNPYKMTIYFSEQEVDRPYKVIGYFEWRRIEYLTHRKHIGRKILKKTNRYIKGGKLPKPDAIIINDFIHATYIQFTEGKSIGAAPDYQKRPENSIDIGELGDSLSSAIGNIKDSLSYESAYTLANAAEFPGLRVGAGFGATLSRRSAASFNLRAGYRLMQNRDMELVPELAFFSQRSGIRMITLNASGRYFFDLKERKIAPLEMRAYPMAGLHFSANLGQRRRVESTGEWRDHTFSPGIILGLGSEYRLGEFLTVHGELAYILRISNTNITQIGIGLNYWLHS